jgi:diacylglycerol kinase
MAFEKKSSFLKSFVFALTGIKDGLVGRNFRVQLVIGLLVVFFAWYLDVQVMEWIALVLSIVMVLSLELFNTALEALADGLSKDHNEGIRKAKDMAAGAVLVASIGAAIVGFIIFIPKLIAL